MANSYRQKMGWLHTWSGLILGWLLFVIFVTGTSSYYKEEITLWMKPELHKSVVNEKSIDIAIEKVLEASKTTNNISVNLPNSRTNTITLMSRNKRKSQDEGSSGGGHIDGPDREHISSNIQNKRSNNRNKKRGKPEPKYYDATTGEEIKTRATAGGEFLYRFHYELYSLPKDVARWIVGIATMAMFLAIISAIIIHKRIFKDIFTFRPKAGPRGWMDAHILPGVAALPFLIMITYSGLLLFNDTIMPWGIKAYYGENFRTYKQDLNTFGKSVNEKTVTIVKKTDEHKNSEASSQRGDRDLQRTQKNSQRGERDSQRTQRNSHRSDDKSNVSKVKQNNKIKQASISKNELKNILSKADEIWPNNIGSFTISKKANSIEVEVNPKDPSSILNFKESRESIVFDAKSGKVLSNSASSSINSAILNTNKAFISLHMAQFADSSLRLIFFICGLSGIILSGTGLILWIKKREHKNSKKKSFGFWLVEKLNLGTIMGIMIAIAIYFIANRLIHADEPIRRSLEINAFFIAWLITYINAFIRNTSKAWIEQLRFASKLFIFIPILNAILVFESFSQIFNRDMILIYFDLFFIFISIVFIFISSILKKKSKMKAIK